VTISDETAAAVEAAAARAQKAVDQLVEEILQRELPPEPTRPLEPFRIEARLLRTRPGTNFNFNKLEALLDEVEGPVRK
jgi:hypothetical protein